MAADIVLLEASAGLRRSSLTYLADLRAPYWRPRGGVVVGEQSRASLLHKQHKQLGGRSLHCPLAGEGARNRLGCPDEAACSVCGILGGNQCQAS